MNMKTQHAPGPWSVEDRYDPPSEVVDANGYTVAEVDGIGLSPAWQKKHPNDHWSSSKESQVERTEEQIAATAYLISAAPELLAVVEGLITQFGLAGIDAVKDSLNPAEALRYQAYEALAKAVGGVLAEK